MASRSTIISLGLLLLSARIAKATKHSVEDLTFMAYEESYGYQTDSSSSPEPTLPSITTPDGGYGYQTSSPPESTPTPITTPTPTPTSTPETPTAPSSSPTCTNSTTTITLPYSTPTPTPTPSHTCHNTTITSTIYPSVSTPATSPSRSCTKSSTTTVTIPWPGTGYLPSGYTPSGTGYPGNNGGWNGTNTYYPPTLVTSASAYPTANTTSNFELPETSEAVQSSSAAQYGGDTPTTTPTPGSEPQPEPSGNVPPAPPASSTGPNEPLFTGGAARYGSGVSLVVAVGALVAWL